MHTPSIGKGNGNQINVSLTRLTNPTSIYSIMVFRAWCDGFFSLYKCHQSLMHKTSTQNSDFNSHLMVIQLVSPHTSICFFLTLQVCENVGHLILTLYPSSIVSKIVKRVKKKTQMKRRNLFESAIVHPTCVMGLHKCSSIYYRPISATNPHPSDFFLLDTNPILCSLPKIQ